MKVAQARLDYCQRKADRVRHWKRFLPHEISEYKGRVSRLKRLVEFEVPAAIGVLEKILRRLEEYSALRVGPAENAYNDLALVQELWPEVDKAVAAQGDVSATGGEDVSATGGEDASATGGEDASATGGEDASATGGEAASAAGKPAGKFNEG